MKELQYVNKENQIETELIRRLWWTGVKLQAENLRNFVMRQLLFVLYIYDLPDFVDCETKYFADDS